MLKMLIKNLLYSVLVSHYEKIESQTQRLENAQLLSELFIKMENKNLDKLVYLTQGKLHPDWMGFPEIGLSEKSIIKAIMKITGYTNSNITKKIHQEGDVGEAFYRLIDYKKNTLSQLSIFIRDKRIEECGVYFQVYEFSDIILYNLFNKFSYNNIFHKIIENFPLLNKILFAQFFFDSKDSNNLVIKKSNGFFSIDIKYNNNKTNKILKKIITKLNRNINLDVAFLSPLTKKFKTGSSYHLGSSFKMQKNKDLFSTDILGRPYNCRKISVVDSTILPSLPSNSHTFLTMSNCYRITDNLINKFDI